MYFGDYVKETTTTTGAGTITLAGAVAQHQAFSAVVLVGDPVEYSILDANGTSRETGIGTLVSATTLSRDTIKSSTNSGAAIVLSSGTHSVLLAVSADALNKRVVMGDEFLDHVVSGLSVPTTSGTLSATVAAGVAYVVGQRVVKGAQTRVYTASKDTYVDLSNIGVLTYSEVANGAGAPSITANSMRLGKVVTSGSAVTGSTDLRNLVSKPSCLLKFDGGTGTIPNTVSTPIPFTTANEIVNNNGMHSGTTNPSRITAVQAGLYAINAYTEIATTGGGTNFYLTIAINGNEYTKSEITTSTSTQPFTTAPSTLAFLQIGDYVEMQLYGSPSTVNRGMLAATRVG